MSRIIDVTVQVILPDHYKARAEEVGRAIAVAASETLHQTYGDLGHGAVRYISATAKTTDDVHPDAYGGGEL